MPVTDLLRALSQRWRLELAIALVVTTLAVAATLAVPRVYTASTTLLVDERAPEPGASDGTSRPAVDMDQLLGTQASIIRSAAVAGAAVDPRDPAAVARWRRATGGRGDPAAWLAADLMRRTTVDTEHGSNILTVRVDAGDAATAAAEANALARAFLGAQQRLSTDPVRAYSRGFAARVAEVRGNLDRAQAALAAFQQAHGVVSTTGIDAESERLSALQTQLAAADAAQAEASARAGGDRAGSAEVQSSTVAAALRTQIADAEGRVAALRETLGPNHPDRQAAEATLASLRARLGTEQGTMARSLSVESSDAARRTASLRALIGAQRGRMLALQADRGQLDVLQRDVATATAAYDGVQGRLNALKLQAEVPRTTIRQLDPATAPASAGNRKLAMRALLGLLLGGMTGVSVAAALEWRRPRVRSDRGLAAMTGGATVIAIPRDATPALRDAA